MNLQAVTNSYLSTRLTLVKIGLAMTLVTFMSSFVKAELLYSEDADNICSPGGALDNYSQYTLGNIFTVGSDDLLVTKLGYADLSNGDGLIDNHQVGIWNMDGTLLGSVMVPSGTSATNYNDFRYVPLANGITLNANTSYIIAGDTAGANSVANDLYRHGTSYTQGIGIANHLGRVQAAKGAGFVFPDSTPITSEAWGLVNMEYSTVPPGSPVEQWTLSTQDTSLTIGLDSENRPAIYGLSNSSQQFNWAEQPCRIPLPSGIMQNGQNISPDWTLQSKTVINNSEGTKLTLQYRSVATGLKFQTEWWARPGQGPIHHSSFIINSGSALVDISYQPTLSLQLVAPESDEVSAWHFKSDGIGGGLDPVGVYQETITSGFSRKVSTNPDCPPGDAIPLAVFDSGGQQGVYVGTEWSLGDIQITGSNTNPKGIAVQSGNVTNFQATLQAGQTFEVPPGFVGAYNGDIDDAGNSLRKYLLNYNMPEDVRDNANYPTVQWNAFGATGKVPESWDPVEVKFYPLIDDMAELGFEEVMIDVGWWQGSEPNADPVDWASGMKAAADYAKQKGIRFGLYWTDAENMATEEGQQTRADRIKRLYQEYGVDLWRSDMTYGPVISPNYWAVKGFYDMLDGLDEEIPNFQWENCSGGGRIKDYGAMKRSVKIFNSDNFGILDVRKVFYDSSFAMHPIQLEGHLGDQGTLRPRGAVGMKYAFRTMSMGAPEWFIDAPNGGNGSDPWTEEEKEAVASSVATYKEKIRPLIRNGNLYHIFPRPDGVVWDGIEYYDPEAQKGVVYIFKPNSTIDTKTITLKGLDKDLMYHLTFEDNSNSALSMSGADLMNSGVDVTLPGTYISELMFINILVPGDANNDGRVDGSDVTILAGNWQVQNGATWEMGDFNGDGKVDGSDVTILAGNWQYGTNSSATTVPEPSALAMIFIGGPCSLWLIQRR